MRSRVKTPLVAKATLVNDTKSFPSHERRISAANWCVKTVRRGDCVQSPIGWKKTTAWRVTNRHAPVWTLGFIGCLKPSSRGIPRSAGDEEPRTASRKNQSEVPRGVYPGHPERDSFTSFRTGSSLRSG